MSGARLDARGEFERDGYLALAGFVSSSRVDRIRARIDRYVAEVAPRLSEHVYCEEAGRFETLKQLQQLQRHDEWFAALFRGEPFERLAEQLLGGPVVGVNMQYFNKPAGVGRPTPPHQDGHYFMIEPCEAVTMWLALDEVDATNGCVRYVSRLALRGPAPARRVGDSRVLAEYHRLRVGRRSAQRGRGSRAAG